MPADDTIRIAAPSATFPPPPPVGLGDLPADLPEVDPDAPSRKRRHQQRLRQRLIANYRASLG